MAKLRLKELIKLLKIIQYLPEPIPHSSICNFSGSAPYLLHCYFFNILKVKMKEEGGKESRKDKISSLVFSLLLTCSAAAFNISKVKNERGRKGKGKER